MVIGLCTIDLHLPGANSLKDKRSVIKRVMRRLRNEFNVSIAEVDQQDLWRSTVIAVVTVSSDRAYAHGLLEKVVGWIERTRLDAQLVDYQIEML